MVDIDRFRSPNNRAYGTALQEIKNGLKESHWIWYIFPQLKGLGMSHTSEFYGIESLEEAEAYLNDPVLGSRLIEITQALLDLKAPNMIDVVGYPDILKVQSCMTLFELVENSPSIFGEVLDYYYDGKRDDNTLRLLDEHKHNLKG